jgi:hypothetical protein
LVNIFIARKDTFILDNTDNTNSNQNSLTGGDEDAEDDDMDINEGVQNTFYSQNNIEYLHFGTCAPKI